MVASRTVIVCVIVMVISLGLEGLVLLFSGFPLPGLPVLSYVIGISWILTCIATFFFPKRPLMAVLLGWTIFALNGYDMWFHTAEEKTWLWFMYQHSLELTFIFASTVGYIFILRRPGRPDKHAR